MPIINPNPTNLEKARRAAGLSREKLAELSGIPWGTIKEYEQGRNNINNARAHIVVDLAEALGVPVQQIMNERSAADA